MSPTFDTGPSEPQPHGVQTAFHFMVPGRSGRSGYVELSYTLPQIFTLFVLMQEQNGVGPIPRQFLTRTDGFFGSPAPLKLSNKLIRRQVAERAVRGGADYSRAARLQ